jgi:CRP-like cAMP-binding protein
MTNYSFTDFIISNIPNITVSETAIERISNAFEIHNLAKNEYLLKEGKISGYYYLDEGFLRSFTHDVKGMEITTAFYGSKRVIFEPASFFLRQPSLENIQALTDCKGFYTTFEKLNGLFHSTPEFREFARAMLVKEFVSFKNETLQKINKSAEERYEDLINTNKEIFQVAHLKHIASYLGMTDTSLSRIRREFARKKR